MAARERGWAKEGGELPSIFCVIGVWLLVICAVWLSNVANSPAGLPYEDKK
jgi:hypothetical protein